MSIADYHPVVSKARTPRNASLYDVKGLPVFGVLLELRRDPPKFLRKLLTRNGPVVTMNVGGERVILAGHPDAIEHVCRNNPDNYYKTKFVDRLKPILGEGLATSNGRTWDISRRIIQPKLTARQVQRMMTRIDEIVSHDLADWNGEIDIAKASCALTLKVISGTMFSNPNAEAAERIVAAIEVMQKHFSKRVWAILPATKWFGGASQAAFAAALEECFALVRSMIAERKAGPRQDDLLQALIEACDPETGAPFSEQQVVDEVMTAFLAGHDTTGNTLAFFWHQLAIRPQLQQEIREEVLRCIPLDRPATFEDTKKLTLTLSALKETMRLHPASWWFARTAQAADRIMGVAVRPGDTVMVAPYVVHRNRDYWDDPERFDAYRFLHSKVAHHFAYIPFGAGPRVCPGQHFATTEMLLVIARLLQRAELKNSGPIEYEALISMRPRDGLAMTVAPWTKVVSIDGVRPGDHALVDTLLRIRNQVFVCDLGWPLTVDEDGREIDEFDTPQAEYSALVSNGAIKAYGRLISTAQPSLLFDVYGRLVENEDLIERGETVWEGTRLGTARDVSPSERGEWLKLLVLDAIERCGAKGVRYFCSVSDLSMEKILRRMGLGIERLGSVQPDRTGGSVLGLRIDCGKTPDELEPTKPATGKCPVRFLHGR